MRLLATVLVAMAGFAAAFVVTTWVLTRPAPDFRSQVAIDRVRTAPTPADELPAAVAQRLKVAAGTPRSWLLGSADGWSQWIAQGPDGSLCLVMAHEPGEPEPLVASSCTLPAFFAESGIVKRTVTPTAAALGILVPDGYVDVLIAAIGPSAVRVSDNSILVTDDPLREIAVGLPAPAGDERGGELVIELEALDIGEFLADVAEG